MCLKFGQIYHHIVISNLNFRDQNKMFSPWDFYKLHSALLFFSLLLYLWLLCKRIFQMTKRPYFYQPMTYTSPQTSANHTFSHSIFTGCSNLASAATQHVTTVLKAVSPPSLLPNFECTADSNKRGQPTSELLCRCLWFYGIYGYDFLAEIFIHT